MTTTGGRRHRWCQTDVHVLCVLTTALMFGAMTGCLPVVQCLLAHGASPTAVSRQSARSRALLVVSRPVVRWPHLALLRNDAADVCVLRDRRPSGRLSVDPRQDPRLGPPQCRRCEWEHWCVTRGGLARHGSDPLLPTSTAFRSRIRSRTVCECAAVSVWGISGHNKA